MYAKNSTVKQIFAKLCNHEENCKLSSKESVIINILLLFKALENDIRIFKDEKIALMDKNKELEKLFAEELSATERLNSEIPVVLEESIKGKGELIDKYKQEDLKKLL